MHVSTSEKEATKIAIAAVVHHTGPGFFERVVRTARREHAKEGAIGWQPSVNNMLFDCVPAPAPWNGQWAYRIRFTATLADGNLNIVEFWLPQSQISLALADQIERAN